YTGNIFNVSASGAASSTGTLANLKSNQLAGQILNVDAQSLTTGKAVVVTLGTGGTGFYLDTAASGYSGNLIQLRANGADRLVIDQAGNTTVGGTLAVTGASTFNGSVTIAANNNFTQNGRATVSTGTGAVSLNGNVTVHANNNITEVGTGAFGTGAGEVSVNGATTVNAAVTIAANNNFIQNGTGTFGTGTGAVSLNGNVTVAANNNFIQNGTGTFGTGTGAVSLNGNTAVTGTLSSTGSDTPGGGSANQSVIAGDADDLYHNNNTTGT